MSTNIVPTILFRLITYIIPRRFLNKSIDICVLNHGSVSISNYSQLSIVNSDQTMAKIVPDSIDFLMNSFIVEETVLRFVVNVATDRCDA